MSVESAQKRVQELSKERGQVVQKMADLEAKKQKAKTGDLASLAGQLAELRQVVPIIDERLQQARVALQAEQKKIKEAEILRLREVETRQWEEAQAVLFGELEPKMQALAATHGKLRALGSSPWLGDPVVFDAIIQAKYARARRTGDYTGHPFTWASG
jgi:hypothetical protein